MKLLAIGAALIAAAIGAIQTAGPDALGLPPLTANWLGVLAVVLAAAQAFLPNVKQTERTHRVSRPKGVA
jgi:hypothetical protein